MPQIIREVDHLPSPHPNSRTKFDFGSTSFVVVVVAIEIEKNAIIKGDNFAMTKIIVLS